MKNNIFYFKAKTQHENLGDRLIARTLLNGLKKQGVMKVNVRGCPRDYINELTDDGYEVLSVSGIKFTLSVLLDRVKGKNVFFMMKPGHFFGADGGPLNRIAQLLALCTFRLFGVKICRFGASIGPFHKFSAMAEKFSQPLYHRYTVRESISQSYCTNLSFNNNETTFFPDLAFGLTKYMPQYNTEKNGASRAFVGLSFRNHADDDKNKKIKKIPPELNVILDNDNLVQSVMAVSQVGRDISFNAELLDLLPSNVKKRHEIYEGGSDEQIFTAYQQCSAVLSNRLHVLLFAASQGALPVAVISNENHKIIGIFKDAGLENLIFNTDHQVDFNAFYMNLLSDYDAHILQVAHIFGQYAEHIDAELSGLTL